MNSSPMASFQSVKASYLTPSPYLDEIITEPFRPDAEGYLNVPDRPGLGIELDRGALNKYGT